MNKLLPDWTQWVLEKNSNAQEEALKKSDFITLEPINKASQAPFDHSDYLHARLSTMKGVHSVAIHQEDPNSEHHTVTISAHPESYEKAIKEIGKTHHVVDEGEGYHDDEDTFSNDVVVKPKK